MTIGGRWIIGIQVTVLSFLLNTANYIKMILARIFVIISFHLAFDCPCVFYQLIVVLIVIGI